MLLTCQLPLSLSLCLAEAGIDLSSVGGDLSKLDLGDIDLGDVNGVNVTDLISSAGGNGDGDYTDGDYEDMGDMDAGSLAGLTDLIPQECIDYYTSAAYTAQMKACDTAQAAAPTTCPDECIKAYTSIPQSCVDAAKKMAESPEIAGLIGNLTASYDPADLTDPCSKALAAGATAKPTPTPTPSPSPAAVPPAARACGRPRDADIRARFSLLGSKHIATKLLRACYKFFKVSDLECILYKATMELTF